MTGWRRWAESYLGGLDAAVPYRSPRTVKIRDCRLGLALIVLQLGILGYVVGYQLIYNQQYMVEGDVVAFSRMQLQRPSAAYRWADGAAPYCSNGTGSPGLPYVLPSPGQYQYTGTGGVVAAQNPCLMMDELYAVPNGIEKDAIFLATRITVTSQQAQPAGPCANISKEFCEFEDIDSDDFYVADAELFTLLVDHSMYASDAGLTRTVRQMSGSMKVRANTVGNPLAAAASKQDRDRGATVVDPCEAYFELSLPCPSFVNVGKVGQADIFPIKTLLSAAGIPTLDIASAFNGSETLRVSGLVLVLEVEYSNFFWKTGSWNGGDVSYTYWVTAVPGSEFKGETALPDMQGTVAVPAPGLRTVYNRHGVRVVISFSGDIGAFNFQAFLINLFVSLGLLGAANALMEFLVFQALPLRHVYRQYKERETVDFGDVLRSRKVDDGALAALLERFASEPHLVDPVPLVFSAVVEAGQAAPPGHMAVQRQGKEEAVGVQYSTSTQVGASAGVPSVGPLGAASGRVLNPLGGPVSDWTGHKSK